MRRALSGEDSKQASGCLRPCARLRCIIHRGLSGALPRPQDGLTHPRAGQAQRGSCPCRASTSRVKNARPTITEAPIIPLAGPAQRWSDGKAELRLGPRKDQLCLKTTVDISQVVFEPVPVVAFGVAPAASI
jgi:hypothetical protein